MKLVPTVCFFALLILASSVSAQTQKERIGHGRSVAQQELKAALAGELSPTTIDTSHLLIKDSLSAIRMAEPILFDIYGKTTILKQRPYLTYMIDHYWVISGTLPLDHPGQTFLLIIDAENAEVIRLQYGY